MIKSTHGRYIIFFSLVFFAFFSPVEKAAALEMPPAFGSHDANVITAKSYIAVDKGDGKVLLEKNPQQPWVPASLTKLVTALVFLDTKPNLNKYVSIKQSDQAAGGCSAGGACIVTRTGVSYRLNDLFHASLISSSNNATAAIARSTGLSSDAFVARMNEKAKALGATNTVFYETTGMNPLNTTTATDFAKIITAAFSNKTIRTIAQKESYSFRAVNNKRYFHKIKNTDKLLADGEFNIVGGKTGFLDESQYNFGAELKDALGNNIIIVLFGSQSSASQFRETKELAALAGLAKSFGGTPALVLGSSSPTTLKP